MSARRGTLKARVQNYTRLGGHTNRIARMIASTASMEFMTTATESEALLLEANLIKRFRPYFNVLMRDDKSFPYILISREHAAPQIMKHRGSRNVKGEYFGPFASAGAVNRTLNMLQRAFLLRSCSDAMFESRTRPCLLYQIKRCSAPCTREISLEDYGKLVDEAERFLQGKTDAVQKKLNSLMETASAELEFERAARYRDRLAALAHVQAAQGINPRGVEEADVFAAYSQGGQSCVQVFFFRSGQNWGNRAYFPRADRSVELEEVLEFFIAQFYDDKPVPRCIFLSHDLAERELLAEALSLKAGRKVEIAVPQRGEKAGLVAHALTNAKEALGRKMADASSQAKLLDGVAAAFGLPGRPERIEVYDNSHIQGTNAVGAMIVAGPEGFVKNQYRKFNIKSEALTPGDDYAMMREVLKRRLTRLAKELAASSPLPRGEGGAPAPGEGVQPLVSTHEPLTPTLSRWEREPQPPQDVQTGCRRRPRGTDRTMARPVDGLRRGRRRRARPGLPPRRPLRRRRRQEIQLGHPRPRPHRRRGRAARRRARRAGRTRHRRHHAGRHRQGTGPQCRPRALLHARPPSFMLEPRDPVLYFVQRLRDEAHRFAIGTHRAKRAKASPPTRLTRLPASARAAAGRCSSISAPRRPSAAPALRICKRWKVSAPPWPRRSTTIFRERRTASQYLRKLGRIRTPAWAFAQAIKS